MGLVDWAIICGTGLLIKSSLKKEKERREFEEKDYQRIIEEIRRDRAEMDRRRSVNSIRESSFIYFNEGISKDEFTSFAKKAAKKISRIKKVEVCGAKIYCTVSSQTGLSDWNFSVDFNNWGHITGVYWNYTENYESSIPQKYGNSVSSMIQNVISEKELNIKDLSDEVDSNKHLCREKLSYHPKEKILKKYVLKNYKKYRINYNNEDLIGEHIFPVVSIFRNIGFNNITVLEAKEATHSNGKDEYEVFNIKIGNSKEFKSDIYYPENIEIKICYYGKKSIRMSKGNGYFKNKNYIDVGNELENMGFHNIYESEMKDMIFDIFKREGKVEKVTIDGKLLEKDKKYLYDKKIVVYYHSKK